jgi:hypothetical protein
VLKTLLVSRIDETASRINFLFWDVVANIWDERRFQEVVEAQLKLLIWCFSPDLVLQTLNNQKIHYVCKKPLHKGSLSLLGDPQYFGSPMRFNDLIQ